MVCAELTAIPGASAAFAGGIVAYTNEIKERLLGVDVAVLHDHGAVSEACAMAMAEGARRIFSADCAIAVTGIAGPEGGSSTKPVGTVWLAIIAGDQRETVKEHFTGSRQDIRSAASQAALLRMAHCATRAFELDNSGHWGVSSNQD
jgi:PncC family amidohydrolase